MAFEWKSQIRNLLTHKRRKILRLTFFIFSEVLILSEPQLSHIHLQYISFMVILGLLQSQFNLAIGTELSWSGDDEGAGVVGWKEAEEAQADRIFSCGLEKNREGDQVFFRIDDTRDLNLHEFDLVESGAKGHQGLCDDGMKYIHLVQRIHGVRFWPGSCGRWCHTLTGQEDQKCK